MSDNPFALDNIQAGGGAAPANDNPFALSNIERDQQADLRGKIKAAVTVNPDQAARAAQLAKKYPVPEDVLARNLQDVELQEAVNTADQRLQTSPKLAQALREKKWLAQQAHDDVGALADVEQFFRDTGGSVKAGVFNASKGAAGVFRAGFELVAPALDFLEPVTDVGGNPLRRLAEGFAMQAEAAGGSAKAVAPKTTGIVSSGFQSGIQSLTQNLLTLPMAFAPGGQAAALGGMTAFTGGQSYQDAREKGLPMSQALPFAASQAAIEYATEKMPLGQLVKDVKIGAPLFQMLTNQLKGEVLGEQVATVLQDLNEWAVLNPEKPFSSYLEERPSAAAQTLVATIVGVGGNVAVVKGIETVVNRAVNGSRQIQEAERTSDGLQTALQAAAASKLRERNPETFKQLVQAMSEDAGGEPSSVFIDAQTLAQTGVNVAEVFPSAAEQLDAALAANGSVEVSMAEVLTAVPGTPLEQVFLQNARGTADGLSLAEAQQAFAQADQWKAEADRVMAEAQDQAAWQADAETVKTTILDQLNTAGRFTPDVNEAYATFVGQFFSVMAARQGITPQEMYARYPLRVAAQQPGQSGGQLEQGSQRFSEDNRLSNLNPNGVSWQRIRENNPALQGKGPDDTVTVYRATVGDTIRPDDFVAVDKSTLRTELRNVRARDGKAAKIIEQQVNVRDLLMGNDASEFVYFPEAQARNQTPDQTAQQPGQSGGQLEQSASIDTVRQQWTDAGIKHSIIESRGRLVLSQIVVPEGERASGKGTVAMQALVDYADQTGQRIELTPSSDFGGNKKRLAEFYKRFGFVENKGRNKDFEVSEAMYRPVQALAQTPDQTAQRAHGTYTPSQILITLNESANLSTFLHESGHFFLEVMADLASQPNAPADVQADMDKLLKWFGIKGEEFERATVGEWADRETAPVGSWVKADFAVGGVHPVYQVREMALDDLYLPELDEKGNLQPEKRKYLADYTERAKAGEAPPSITVIEMENGKMRVVDGHRRAMAARAAGKTLIRALVSPLVDTAEGKQEATTANINPSSGSTAGMAPKGASYTAGRTPLEVWNAMALDQKRQYHERFAESFEQYLLEGKAPSTELQPLFRKFRSWLVNVYKSLTQFMRGRDLKLNDETRKVFDRMLATDEQIRQAEEAAGMLPDFDATNGAIEKLQARSLRDMKWAVGARSRALKALQKQAKELRKGVEDEVRAEVNAMPEFAAQRDLDTLRKENKRQPNDVEMAVVAEAHGFATTEAMLKAITDVGKKADVIEGMTDQRMLERHGDLIDQRAIEDAATEAVHNAVRARVLATELKAQADALNPRQDTGRTASNGRAITVNALTEAAKQFAQNVVARRRVTDLRKAAAQHRAAEAKAGKRWQEATAAGNTQDAVAAKRDQLLNNYTVKALTEAQAEAKKILEFFRKVTKDGNEKLVERGRDPDVVNAMRAILAAYDVAPRLEKAANDYMEIVARNDPAMFAALQPSVQGALQNAKPIGEMTVEELRGLNDEMQSMWHLAKRSRQMEIDGNLLDREDLEDELVARMAEIGIPDTVPGERSAITNRQELGIKLQFAKSILSRVEQWAERLDGKFGGPFLRYIFQPVKEAADRYRSERTVYRKKFTALVDGIRYQMPAGPIEAPELGYTFGNARDSGMAEVMHAILHTGNDSNKRKLLLGRNWAAENADGTLDTSRWDAFVQRLIDDGKLTKAHYDFAQGVWDLLEEMKPAAQRAHREVFGRYFAEVTANEFTTPFGTYKGGYVPAQTDSRIVDDAKLRELAEGENESMAYAFPAAPSGFTKARVEYNKPLLLDLRALAQHMDKVLLFTHMQPAITDARRLLMSKRVSYALNRVDPGAYEGMLIPWLNRSAKQIVETPIMGDRKLSRFLAAARARAGMALMFANVSNTVQQLTGFSSAAVKVKPSLMMSALAQFVAHPKQIKQEVAQASEFMRDRMLNEVSAMNNVVEEILVNPNLYERSQAWTQRHAYFLQSAVDNTMAPIIWTAAYNQAIGEKMDAKDAVRFADGVIRQTQGSTLPEDVSRFETGPATARLFTQFIGYFNMMANTNATAVSQIVGEMGLRKGAGKLLYVALAGLLVPIWVAESIALAFKGGPDDEDKDGYLDDWLAAVFGLGTFKGIVAQVPLVGQGAQLVVSQFNKNPADDKFSLSPAVSLIESTAAAPKSVYKAIVDDGNAQKAVRDVAAAATLLTGLPFYAAARPVGYAAGVAQGKIEPTSGADAVRGAITGTASKESKSP